MPKINILTPEIAQLIAAGEVVERPGSVIKEMVENSIDAGATRITVEIRNGGNTFLRVSDNGCGIAREDCPAAFMPHATSKIKDGADLDSIGTLGFRGEALASVASVAKVEMITKTAEEEIGTRVIIHGGEIIDIDDAGCSTGTVITVRELFYNTPARRKFLKKDMTEGANIAGIMDRIALSHPEISFTLRKENDDVLFTSGDGELMNAVSSVLGKEVAEGMIKTDSSSGQIKVSGCICRPVNSRPNRNLQIFFLNGRFVRSKTFVAAIEQAYKDSIMVGKFPACVLNVTMPYDMVDVNVHPSKMEVRFADEQMIFRAVYHSVKDALESSQFLSQRKVDDSIITRPATFADEKPIQGRLDTASKTDFIKQNTTGGFYRVDLSSGIKTPVFQQQSEPIPVFEERPSPAEISGRVMVASPSTYTVYPVKEEQNKSEQEVKVVETELPFETEEKKEEQERPVCRYIGEAFETYIIAECGDSVFFVDKHALHERMLYEKLKENEGVFSQPLLTPIPVTLEKEEYGAVLENAENLMKAGFDLSDFGNGTVLVRAMPMYYEKEDAAESLVEIAGKLILDRNCTTTEKIDWLFRSVACRGAIKAGARSSKEELMKLLENIIDIRYCPHGRPVTLELTKQKLEKEFHRQ